MKRIIIGIILLFTTITIYADPMTSTLKIVGNVSSDSQAIILNKDDYGSTVSSINNYSSAKKVITDGNSSTKPNVQKVNLIKDENIPIGFVVFASNEDKRDFSLTISYDNLVSNGHDIPYNIYLDDKLIPSNFKLPLTSLTSYISGTNYNVYNVKMRLKDSNILHKGEYDSEVELTLIKN